MKKSLLRTLSAVVAVSMFFCMSMVAFADMTTTASITTYDGEYVTVETTVAGAKPSEQVAFLTETAEAIIGIDQQTADASGNAKSRFTAQATEAVGATVRFGTYSTPTSVDNNQTIAWDKYTINWSAVTNNNDTPSKVLATVGASEFADDNSATVSQEDGTITFYVFPAPDEELKEIYKDDVSLAFGVIGNSFAYPLTADATYRFVFGAKEVTENVTPTASISTIADAVVPYNDTTKFASVAAIAADATDYGIVVARKAEDITLEALETAPKAGTDAANGASIIKLPALGSNADGCFVIKIDDAEKTFFTGGNYFAKVYTINAYGSDLSEAFALN